MTVLLNEGKLKYFIVWHLCVLILEKEGEKRGREGYIGSYTYPEKSDAFLSFLISKQAHATKTCIHFNLDVKWSRALYAVLEQEGLQAEHSACRDAFLIREVLFPMTSTLTS